MARTNLWKTCYFEIDSFIAGYHVYKDQWIPEHGEMLTVENEPDNEFDRFSVALKKSKNVIGHLPRNENFLSTGNKILQCRPFYVMFFCSFSVTQLVGFHITRCSYQIFENGVTVTPSFIWNMNIGPRHD